MDSDPRVSSTQSTTPSTEATHSPESSSASIEQEPGSYSPRENPVAYFLQALKFYEVVFEELELKHARHEDLQVRPSLEAAQTLEDVIKGFDGVLRSYLKAIFIRKDSNMSSGAEVNESVKYSVNRRGAAVYLAATVGISNLLLQAPSYLDLTLYEEETLSTPVEFVDKNNSERKNGMPIEIIRTCLKKNPIRLRKALRIASEAKRYELALADPKSIAQRKQEANGSGEGSEAGLQQDPNLQPSAEYGKTPQHGKTAKDGKTSLKVRLLNRISSLVSGYQPNRPSVSGITHSNEPLDLISDALEKEIAYLATIDFTHVLSGPKHDARATSPDEFAGSSPSGAL
jgi:hypothetical protein